MNINKDIKETVRLSALEKLAIDAGIGPQQIKAAQKIIAISNQDAIEREMEQGTGIPMTIPSMPPLTSPMPSDPRRMAGVKAVQDALRTESQLDNLAMMKMRQAKEGGMVYGGYSGMVPGEGHGMQDNVYMPIVDRAEGQQVATLAVSPDEYIVDAATVAALGNGSSDAGAKVLDETIKDIRQEAFGTTKQPNQINGLASLQQALESNIG
jgi:hypothetical protein|tara:strand:- start:1985 stop:2614 length:630 start_codon:yes stop_codon:yes gene_type:complete